MTQEEFLDKLNEIQKMKCETQILELKSAKEGCPKRLYDSLSSFSNQDDGGIIVFGIDEKNDYQEVGVYDAQDIQKKINEQCLQMEPIVRPIQSSGKYTLVEVEIITGRTHQIRAHLAKAGHPVIGDVKYGDKRVNGQVRQRFDLNTQLLHAYKLHFEGCTGELAYLNGKTVYAELPEDFQRIKTGLFGEDKKEK